MAFRLSTGTRSDWIAYLQTLFANGTICVYSGVQPATSDLAETGTRLLEITLGGAAFTPGSETNGINFEVSGSELVKASGEIWMGTGLASGTAGWFRFYDNAKVEGASTSAVRFDGTCGTSGAQMILSNTAITSGASSTIDNFQVVLPAS